MAADREALAARDEFGVLYVVCFFTLLGAMVVGVTVDAFHWWAALGLPVLALWVWVVVRAARVKVTVDAAGLTIRMILVTVHVARDDFAGLTWTRAMFPGSGWCAGVERRSYPTVRVWFWPPTWRRAIFRPDDSALDDLTLAIRQALDDSKK